MFIVIAKDINLMKDSKWSFMPTLLLSMLLIIAGVIMIIEKMVGVGFRAMYAKTSGAGGELFIFVGIILLVVTYFSISPFSKFRQLFEGSTRRKKKVK